MSHFPMARSLSVKPRGFVTLALLLLLPVAHATDVQELRMWQAPDHTRLVFDLSAAADYELFMLHNPERIVVDIDQASLSTILDRLDFTGSPIQAIRSGTSAADTLRIVLDLRTVVRPSSFRLPPNADFGHRLVVDLYYPDSTTASGQQAVPAPVATDNQRDIVIAISAGHGGEDPGSIGYDGRIKEKHVTLAIAQALHRRLDSIPGYQPVLIREGDYYVELKKRPEIARRHRADLFVAIHADWYRNARARGVTVYALSGERADRENAARVAAKENSSDLLGGVGDDLALSNLADDLALTLVSLKMDWSMEQSVIAGSHLLASLDGVTHIRRDKVQQASLQVLNSPDIPSILVETGYLTNPAEARRLNTPGFQQRLAAAMADGITHYFYAAPPAGTLVAWQKQRGITPGSYLVKRGDSLSVIAQRFGISLRALQTANQLSSERIYIGQQLAIPGDESASVAEHTIQRGETLSEIARLYRVSVSRIKAANRLSSDRILVGQVLKIPNL